MEIIIALIFVLLIAACVVGVRMARRQGGVVADHHVERSGGAR